VLLQALAVIERLGIDPDPLGPDAGLMAEVFRLVSIDRDRYLADPRRALVPVHRLRAGDYLGEIATRVRESPGEGAAGRGHTDTIALVAADDSGLAIALVQSLFDAFGSGILDPTTGIVLHSRGSAVAGTMGGGGQPQIDAMTLIRALDLGMGAATAVAAPRWLVGGMSLGSDARSIVVEASVPPVARHAFATAGFAVRDVGPLDGSVGHAHLLLARDDGTLEAGSDPRADGEAAAG
jgi:gamma-glutamyltranspeptidase/glutathione hydrolase